MSLLEVVVAMSIALMGALGLNLAWSQSLVLEQQLVQARAARSEALALLYQWQQAPQPTMWQQQQLRFHSQAKGNNVYSWQLEFHSLAGKAKWHGIWAPRPQIHITNTTPPVSCR
ncbi:type IV pilus modification PilV family protein [Aliidiomarina quisquiliarum]|uniref:type IV pilus modification PilV family protein n=1 Tax=Aliidiomarina quisquiliarum TaxID=2938947 RepID=UPI00208EA5B7|nr:hypothetical protein [Aliidiomarina quisquiliarum]MCO4321674.1 hypothetical protein [Aliidiomarina quisquiliarum]